MRLWVTMQQQQWRFAAVIADAGIDHDAVGCNALESEVLEHPRSLGFIDQPCIAGSLDIGGIVDVPQRVCLGPAERTI